MPIKRKNRTIYSPDCQWVLDHPELDDRVRLRVIEKELDNTDPDGPYRSGRARLNRIRGRILRRLEGKDLRFKVTGVKGKVGGLTASQLEELRILKAVEAIKKEVL